MIHSVKGTQDIYGTRAKFYEKIVKASHKLADVFGFSYLELPKIEYKELFLRGVGQDTDVVSKELFQWEDQGGRALCLRPEGTAQTVRFLLQEGQHREGKGRYFYLGSMFRAEKPQKGRLREFHQIGIELFGESSFLADIETIQYAWLLLQELGIHDPILKLNSIGCSECRPLYLRKLEDFLSSHKEELSPLSKERLKRNPLRILDSKDQKDQQILSGAPIILDYLCSECQEHFEGVKEGLSILNIPFALDTKLVRGLDYYTKTTFEITLPSLLGSQDAVCGGGRYDGLVRTLSEKEDIPAVGLALGIERLMIALEELSPIISGSNVDIAVLSEKSFLSYILPLVTEWRKKGQKILLNIDNKSLGKRITQVHKNGIPFIIIVGSREVEEGVFTIKNLNTSTQKILSQDEVTNWLSGDIFSLV